jgi:hypothetical protein
LGQQKHTERKRLSLLGHERDKEIREKNYNLTVLENENKLLKFLDKFDEININDDKSKDLLNTIENLEN